MLFFFNLGSKFFVCYVSQYFHLWLFYSLYGTLFCLFVCFVGARNCDFIQKASRSRGWWTSVPKNHLCMVPFDEQMLLILKLPDLFVLIYELSFMNVKVFYRKPLI